jgi:hypothetical protein
MTRKQRETRDQKPEAGAAEAQDAPGPSREEIINGMLRKLNTFAGAPGWCRATVCKRARRCVHPSLRCAADRPPLPPMTAEEEAAGIAGVRKALDAEIVRRGGLGAAGAAGAAGAGRVRSRT